MLQNNTRDTNYASATTPYPKTRHSLRVSHLQLHRPPLLFYHHKQPGGSRLTTSLSPLLIMCRPPPLGPISRLTDHGNAMPCHARQSNHCNEVSPHLLCKFVAGRFDSLYCHIRKSQMVQLMGSYKYCPSAADGTIFCFCIRQHN